MFGWKLIASWATSVNRLSPNTLSNTLFYAFKFNFLGTLIFYKYGLWLGGIRGFVYKFCFFIETSCFLISAKMPKGSEVWTPIN